MNVRKMTGIVGLALLALTTGASASVYDDVTAWWHLDYADSGNVAAAGDIRDQRAWGAAGSYKATSVFGTPAWTTSVPSQSPAGGQAYGGRGLNLTPTEAAPDGFDVSNLSLAGNAALVTRFKWDGYTYSNGSQYAWLYKNASNWMLGLTGANGNPRILDWGGSPDYVGPNWTTATDTWYDFAVVFDETNDTIRFYRWEEGGAFESWTSPGGRNFSAAGSGTRVGTEATGGGNAKKSFGGIIENLAVWNRALSEADIHEAFGSPDPLWSIGIDNGSHDDMRHEGQTDADYTIGEPWHEMRRAVTTGTTTANVQIDLSSDPQDAPLAGLPFVFHLNAQSASGGQIAASLNGTNLGTRTINAGEDHYWFVPAGMLVVGPNTLTIQNVGSSTVSWDWMELGGAWQVGYDDNSQAEFGSEGAAPDDFYVTDPNWLHLERAMTASDPDINLHFFLSDELAQPIFPGMAYYYTTEVISQDPVSGNAFDVLLNGNLLANIPASANNTVISLGLPFWMLQGGENVISLQWAGAGTHTQFDFHRLELMPEPATLSLLGLGALALLRRRRKKR